MKKIAPILPEWIEIYASPGAQVDLDDGIEFVENERLWYLLTLFCPMMFECYAVVLHPFWVQTGDNIRKQDNTLVPKKDKNYKATTWVDFFKMHNKQFDLRHALDIKEEIGDKVLKDGIWPVHIRFPAEGDIENSQAVQIRNVIKDLYGDVNVNYYYNFLKVADRYTGEDILLNAKLSELEELWSREDIRDNPSAIYPDTKQWCIITDYDSQMTYISGSQELIRRLCLLVECDIYQLEPKKGN